MIDKDKLASLKNFQAYLEDVECVPEDCYMGGGCAVCRAYAHIEKALELLETINKQEGED